MDQPRRSSRHRSEVCYDERVAGRVGRRASRISAITDDSREGLGMKVIAVMVERYGVLPKELWDLNSISDMGAGRGVTYDENVSKAMLKSITSNKRFNITNLTIMKGAHKVSLPDTLQRLSILVEKYNYPLDLPASLQELSFDEPDCNYNQLLVLPDRLRKLHLGDRYNRPITFPLDLLELELGEEYSQQLVLPPRLKSLVFDWESRFNLPVVLPPSLLCIKFGDSYNQPTTLPLHINELGVGRGFTHDFVFPSSLRTIEWRCNRAVQFPEGISELTLEDPFDQPVALPASLKKLTFVGESFSHPLNFPTELEELRWQVYECDGLVLPASLQKLTWESISDVVLPSGLKELTIADEAPLVLKEGLLKIKFDACMNESHYDLPASVQEVTWSVYSNHTIFTHPTTLQHLIVGDSYEDVDLSSHKIHKLTISDSDVRIDAWPQGLKELEFLVDDMDSPLRVPQGVEIVGGMWPANVTME